MAIRGGPAIVTTNLMLRLDAGSLNSYPGAGSGYYDLSSNNKHCGLIGATYRPDVAGGVMAFDGSNDWALQQAGTLGLAGPTSFTISFFSYWSGAAWSSNFPSAFGNNTVSSNSHGLSTTFSNGRTALDFWVNRWRAAVTNSGQVQRWDHYTYVKTAGSSITGTCSLFVNGQLIAGALEASDVADITDAGYVVGRLDATRWYNGYIGPISVYTGAQTAEQVRQNFDAQRSRFGL